MTRQPQHFKVGDTVNVMSGVGGSHLMTNVTVTSVTPTESGGWHVVTDYVPKHYDGTPDDKPASIRTQYPSGKSDFMGHSDWLTARCGC